MKTLSGLIVLCLSLVVFCMASESQAQIFGRSSVNVNGNSNVNVQSRDGLFGGRSNINVNSGVSNVNVQSRNGLFGRNQVNVNVNDAFRQKNNAVNVINVNNGLRHNNANVINVANGFQHHGANQANVIFSNGFHGNRVNAFGSRTLVDNHGNVFEVNSFGAPVIRSSGFRGFAVAPLGFGGCN